MEPIKVKFTMQQQLNIFLLTNPQWRFFFIATYHKIGGIFF